MKIAGWEVPKEIIDAAAKRMRQSPFDAAHMRGVALQTGLLPTDNFYRWYIREEIGTRLIAHFKRAGKIQSIPGSRNWKWVRKTGEPTL
jgi:hypothetical protein